MKIAVPREVNLDERRVALVPDVTARLVKAGLDVWVETGAGERACFPDAVYATAGAHILTDPAALWGGAVGSVLAVLTFVVGNALTFALEALVAAVQALRLEYYELFSRIFAGEGRRFTPWHIPLDTRMEAAWNP